MSKLNNLSYLAEAISTVEPHAPIGSYGTVTDCAGGGALVPHAFVAVTVIA